MQRDKIWKNTGALWSCVRGDNQSSGQDHSPDMWHACRRTEKWSLVAAGKQLSQSNASKFRKSYNLKLIKRVSKQHTAAISLGSIQRSLRSSKSRLLCLSFRQTPRWAIGSTPHGLHTSVRSRKTETYEALSYCELPSLVPPFSSLTACPLEFLIIRTNFRIEFPTA